MVLGLCKKKNFISPQWLRNMKHKKYPLWRLDTIFSKKKYNNIYYVDNGGWHFTNIKTPENIHKKLLNYTHHNEFEESGINLDDLKKKIKKKEANIRSCCRPKRQISGIAKQY